MLLGHYQIQKYLAGTRSSDDKAVVLSTVVSSRMLKAVAEAEGIHYAATLTGATPPLLIQRLFTNLTPRRLQVDW